MFFFGGRKINFNLYGLGIIILRKLVNYLPHNAYTSTYHRFVRFYSNKVRGRR